MAHPLESVLIDRSSSSCELCASTDKLAVHEVEPVRVVNESHCALVCENCLRQITGGAELDGEHLRCLKTSAWSQVPSVQVLAWRLLKRMETVAWAQELFEQLYLDEETLEWASDVEAPEQDEPTLDSNGTRLNEGDTVQIIKDLDVKGTGFVAKRGTMVKNIHLIGDPANIEGRVNKTTLVLKTCFLKKA
ncbi:MAG: PhnA domain-containing protein [Mariniblastus sp.]